MSKGPKLGEKKKFNLPHIFIILFFIVLWSGNIDSSSIRQYHRHGCPRSVTAPFESAGMAPMAGLAGVKLEKWWKFIFPVFFALVGVRAVLMVIAVAMGFGA